MKFLNFDMPDARYLSNLSALAPIVMLSGCAVIDMGNPPSADFPKLDVVEQQVDPARFGQLCGFGNLSCSQLNFNQNRCYVIYTGDPVPFFMDHERRHCKGFSHVGSNQAQEQWDECKRARDEYRLTGTTDKRCD